MSGCGLSLDGMSSVVEMVQAGGMPELKVSTQEQQS